MVIFNPQHDLCLANGDVNYVPPVSALQFAKECKWIEKYMIPVKGEYITPWGWNNCLRNKLLKQGVEVEKLPSDKELDFIAQNSRRELAVELHEFIIKRFSNDLQQCESLSKLDYRIVATDADAVEEFVSNRGGGVLKVPLSGSGKGIRYVGEHLNSNDYGWIRRVLERQGALVVEQKKEILLECAMLFLCTKDRVEFKGYSLFDSINGVYRANVLASNNYIENVLKNYVFESVLGRTRDCIIEFFIEKLVGNYVGYVGVDQMCCKDGFVCASEINLRMTMGHIARNIYDLYANEYNLVDGEFSFSPVDGIIRL